MLLPLWLLPIKKRRKIHIASSPINYFDRAAHGLVKFSFDGEKDFVWTDNFSGWLCGLNSFDVSLFKKKKKKKNL